VTQTIEPLSDTFVERRGAGMEPGAPRYERRQFAGSYSDLSPEGRALGQAIDQYKLQHRRRFVTYDEILAVVKSLGYKQG